MSSASGGSASLSAARADGRQQPARRVRHDQQHGVGRRLLEDLQHRVGAVAVHLVGRIDDGDAPLPHRRRHVHEGAELAHVVDGDLGAHAAGVGIERAAQMEQVGMRARIDQRAARRIGRHVEPFRRAAAEQPALLLAAQQEAREAPGQRRLADAARPRHQPGMVQPAALVGREHGLLGRLVAQQPLAAPRRRPVVGPFELLELAGIDARLAPRHPSGSQPILRRIGDRAGDRIDRSCSIDHDAALGLPRGDFEESGAHPGMEVVRQALVARLRRRAARPPA